VDVFALLSIFFCFQVKIVHKINTLSIPRSTNESVCPFYLLTNKDREQGESFLIGRSQDTRILRQTSTSEVLFLMGSVVTCDIVSFHSFGYLVGDQGESFLHVRILRRSFLHFCESAYSLALS